ncbi:MAG TPA: hypothetical protein DCE76_11255 [Anaerolineaceae bacterium]|nr:hypothetical protein [Anaerolineaceae bacterium]
MPKNKSSSSKDQPQDLTPQPWIPFKTGLIVVGVVSVLLAIWTVITSNPELDLLERILWGVVFGGSIWVVFLFFLVINRLLRRRK